MTDVATLHTAPQRAKFPLHTYSLPEPINLKTASDALFPGVSERYDQDCLIFHISESEKLFIFKFGAVVFFNVPVGGHENYLSRLGISNAKRAQTTGEVQDDYAEDEVTLKIEPGLIEVGFNTATIPEFDLSLIQIVAQVLAQSSALETLEWEVEEFLKESDRLTRFLQGREFKRPRRTELLRFLGSGLNTKHRIVTQLSLLNEPDKTWDREQAYRFFRDLYNNFDIRDRVEKVDKMLSICSEVSELLLEIVNTRRAEILETIIIVLIAIELLKSMFL